MGPMVDQVPGWKWADVSDEDIRLEWTPTSLELTVREPHWDGTAEQCDDAQQRRTEFVLSLPRLYRVITACKTVKQQRWLVVKAQKKRRGPWESLKKQKSPTD